MDTTSYVRWLRSSSPYIHAHRGRTFVVTFGGETLLDPTFPHLIHDLALLHGLGARLVLVYGIRPQIENRLSARGIAWRYADGLRITDAAALACVKEAAGTARVEIEALLSMGLADSPMAGVRLRVSSGNFVTAKPLGVRDGVDFEFTGEVRRVDKEAIHRQLDQGNLVTLAPLGYSPTGEIFNLSAEEVATSVASALNADKLLILMETACRDSATEQAIPQMTCQEARDLLVAKTFDPETSRHLEAAVAAINRGVARVHLLDRHTDGALLLELFTRDGIGTLISAEPFENLRPARLEDIPGILELIEPFERQGILVKRSREKLEMEIGDFWVIDRDGLVVGCAALHAFPTDRIGELACLVLHPDYRGQDHGRRLLEHIEYQARRKGLTQLVALTTRTAHWFLERGFQLTDFKALPTQRRKYYNNTRNSKVLIKAL
ncbi:amino-acid N-acetyltransferase [Methylohalobius crimeensis]|uniref:amino-acid N-acetyltransferase n=1 Tax=Methylohalobius crimeensis TaxID=244365 RepID=UPI0003B6AE3D|nr:amino-acid N-acetyltransferase [Methylohalobius crimeensis]